MSQQLHPLTNAQKRIFLEEKIYHECRTPLLSFLFSIDFELSNEEIQNIVNQIIEENDSLRLQFTEVGEEQEIKQHLTPFKPSSFDNFDFSGKDGLKNQDLFCATESKIRFNLFEQPLYYFAIVKQYDGKMGLFLRAHHLIIDGWTVSILKFHLFSYAKSVAETGSLPKLNHAASYIDYINDEEKYLQSAAFKSSESFWLDEFKTIPQEVNLSINEGLPQNIDVKERSFEPESSFFEKMLSYAEAHHISPFKQITSALSIYINKLKGLDDFCIGTVNHNRSQENWKEMTGMFVSSFPLRFKIDQELSFSAFATNHGSKLNAILKNHQAYPYNLLALKLREKWGRNPNYLLNIMVAGHPEADDNYFHSGQESAPLVIHAFIDTKKRKLLLQFFYNNEIYDALEIESLYHGIYNILNQVYSNKEILIKEIELLSEAEKQQIITEFNNTAFTLDAQQLFHTLFEKQVEKHPELVALVFKEKSYTFRQLNTESNRLAHHLRTKGAKPEAIIGIYMDRSADMVIALLAVLKAGAAYMPIDQDYPSDRIEYMLENSRALLLITKEKMLERINYTGESLLLDSVDLSHSSPENPTLVNSNSDLMYVIYTSGSTGKPKGVMIEHHSVFSYTCSKVRDFNSKPGESYGVYLSFGFDAFGDCVFKSLASAGAIHILPDELRLQPIELNTYLEEHAIDHIDLPTQFGTNFLELVTNNSLKTIILGGEKLHQIPENCKQLIYNEYGPTEATIAITSFFVDRNYANIPIGKPIGNTTVLILDKNGQLMPIGLPGELCILGNLVGRGYLNLPKQTAEKFVECPALPGQRMYKTGDLARWLPDGNIECLGRIDMQVKIRGFRVELGEIESVIKQQTSIENAVVIDLNDPNSGKFLCAYYISENEIDRVQFKRDIGEQLPEYMVPEFYIKIDSVPYTPNGKVDRRALPEPKFETKKGVKPTREIEKKIAAIWEKALHVENINIDDNFFELGGQSLIAAIVQARVQQQLKIKVSLQDLFQHPTVEKFVTVLESADTARECAIKKVATQNSYPTTPQQRRLFILNQIEPNSTTYNVPGLWKIKGALDSKKFAQAIDKVVERYATLRTTFATENQEIVQIIHPKLHIKKVFEEQNGISAQRVIENYIKPFNLTLAPLFRIFLLKRAEDEYFFLFDSHHIIIDGISQSLFIKELLDIYSGYTLHKTDFEYTDYAVWYQDFQKSERIEQAKNYWLKRYENQNPELNLPLDFPRPAVMDNYGKQYLYQLPAGLKKRISSTAKQLGTTTFNTLLTAYAILLKRYSGNETFVVGIPSSGRNIPEIETMLGMFVNTLPILINFDQTAPVKQVIQEVGNRVLEAIKYQDYQLDTLIEELQIPRSAGRNPLVEVMFTYVPESKKLNQSGLTISKSDFHFDISKFDLTLHVIEQQESFALAFEYRTALFHEETMARLGDSFTLILEAICNSTVVKSNDIEIISKHEKDWILNSYNNTHKIYDPTKSVIECFEANVQESHESVAISYGTQTLSYRELNQKANILAHKLRQKGVRSNQVIGVMMERSPEVVIAFLAINKAGAAYVPIDPEYPADRINYILENSATQILLTKERFANNINFSGEQILVDINDEALFSGNVENPKKITFPSDLVYLIYTSGSTGQPKGVMLTQQGLMNYIGWAMEVYLKGEKLTFPLYSSISFDLTVTSIFTPLASGGKIIIYSDEDKSMTISRIIRDNRVDVVKLTPTHLKIMEHEALKNSRIKRLIVGGEELQSDLAKRIYDAFGGDIEILNEYGPTETVVGCMIHSFNPDEDKRASVSIGTPADNARIYILDKQLQLVPKGVVGELYIAGDGVARGYMNRPDITSERFLADPFVEGDRVYKSGDLACFVNDEIEFRGRVDFQVKIHGFRIELNEIETRLRAYKKIEDIAVIAREDNSGDKYLCAYYISDFECSNEELSHFIKETLPDYMVPAWFIKMAHFPLTPNGKTDSKRLPDPISVATDHTVIEAQSAQEKTIVDAFKKTLSLDQISTDDNFFQIGGNSLKAVTLTVLLQKVFEVSVNDIFKYQTPQQLSNHLKLSNKNSQSRLNMLKDLDKIQKKALTPTPETAEKIALYRNSFSKVNITPNSDETDFQNILLTGTTGFLGIWLLKNCLKQTEANLHLPIRAKNDAHALRRVLEKWDYYFPEEPFSQHLHRLNIFAADLEIRNLGIDDTHWNTLSETIDCIINPAANVRHYGKYEQFYKSNVGSVLNLLKLCKSGCKTAFNQVSTLSIGAGTVDDQEQILFTETDLDIGQKSDNVYLQTKMEAEKELINARTEGIDTSIFRIGNITFDSQNGQSQVNLAENGFFQVVNALINIGIVPRQSIAYEFSFVDKVAESILTLMKKTSLSNSIWHIQNPNNQYLESILRNQKLNLNLRFLSFNNFLEELSTDADVEEFSTLVDNLMLHRGWLESDAVKTTSIILSEKSNYVLKMLGFKWPKLSPELFKNLVTESLQKRIQYFKNSTLFSEVSENNLYTIAAQSREICYSEEGEILNPLMKFSDLYFVKRGIIEVSLKSVSGWSGTLEVLSEGGVIGTEKVFHYGEDTITLTAILGDAVIYKLPIKVIRNMLNSNEIPAIRLLESLSNRVINLSQLFVEIG